MIDIEKLEAYRCKRYMNKRRMKSMVNKLSDVYLFLSTIGLNPHKFNNIRGLDFNQARNISIKLYDMWNVLSNHTRCQ